MMRVILCRMSDSNLWSHAHFSESLHRARDLFTWLAMQGVEPFLPRFGLGRLDAQHLRRVAREYLSMYDGLDLRAGVWPETQFDRALEAVEGHDGPGARAAVAMFHAIGIPDWDVYARSMTVWVDILFDIGLEESIERVGVPPEVRPLLCDRMSPDHWLQAVEVAGVAMDSWEVGWYATWDQEVGHGTSPIEGLRSALNYNDLHDAWFEMRAALPGKRIQSIEAWFKQEAWRNGWFEQMPAPELEGWNDWRVLRGLS
jgi:hypothetical protein